MTKADLAARAEHAGRKIGKPHGSWVTDLAELQKSILLCDSCHHRFNHVQYGYYRQREFPYVAGKCDACKRECYGHFFIHEAYLHQVWSVR